MLKYRDDLNKTRIFRGTDGSLHLRLVLLRESECAQEVQHILARKSLLPKNYNNECLNQLSYSNFAFATTFHVNMEVAFCRGEDGKPLVDWQMKSR